MGLSNRLVVLGLDSLPPGLTRDLAKSGVMPFINELMEKGSFGTLHSVTPSNTGSGWNSAWTGLPPTQHGYFGFYHYDPQDDIIRVSTSDRLKVPTLWQMLNGYGLKTLVINSPMQYPATKLDGVMVSGFMAPSIQAPCAYPPSFHEKLKREIPDYIFDVPWDKHNDDDRTFEANIAAVIKVFNQRVAITKLAAGWTSWDVLIIVFKSVDNMLHYTWDYIANEHSNHKRRQLTLNAFRILDDACRKIALMAGYPDANILVCSDHGHGPIKGQLFINRLLAQWGLLTPQSRLNKALTKHIISIRKRIRIGKFRKKLSTHISARLKVKWNKSRAIVIQGSCIYLNVKGRQPQGIISPQQYERVRRDIANRLRLLKDETTGATLIEKLDCPVEATPKPIPLHEPAIPDIIFQPVSGVVIKKVTTREGPIYQPGHYDNNHQGSHTPEGIILGAGPNFARAASVEGNLYDVAPTALAACGLPIPHGLVGKPIAALLNHKVKIKYDTKKAAPATSESPSLQAYSSEEEEIIRQRLTNLGYLD